MIVRIIPVALLLVACVGEAEEHTFDTPDNYQSRSGKTIYQKHCVVCHGEDGKLGSGGAKDLTVSKMDSTDIVSIIRNGKNGMSRQIQYFKSDEEIENTIDYLKSLRK